MDRKPCHYCKAEDGIDSLGIGFSGRCGRHYYRPAFPPEAEALEPEAPPVEQIPGRDSQPGSRVGVDFPPSEQAPGEGETIEMFPLGSGPARQRL